MEKRCFDIRGRKSKTEDRRKLFDLPAPKTVDGGWFFDLRNREIVEPTLIYDLRGRRSKNPFPYLQFSIFGPEDRRTPSFYLRFSAPKMKRISDGRWGRDCDFFEYICGMFFEDAKGPSIFLVYDLRGRKDEKLPRLRYSGSKKRRTSLHLPHRRQLF